MYTYDIKNNNVAVIRQTNKNDLEENIFDDLTLLIEQLHKENYLVSLNV